MANKKPIHWIPLAPGIYVCELGYVKRLRRAWMAHAFGRIARHPYRSLSAARQAVENRE